MPLELKHNEEYDNYSFDLKQLADGEGFQFTIREITTGPGKFGKPWYLVIGTLHRQDGDKEASFFTRGFGPGRKQLGEALQPFISQRVRMNVTWKQGKMHNKFQVWSVSVVGGQTPAPAASSTPTAPEGSNNSDFMINAIVSQSNGQKQSAQWVEQQLRNAGITDQLILTDLLDKYMSRW